MPEVGAHRDPLFDRGRGLRNMEQRARSLGGKCTVNTDSGDTGTVVEWRVPVGR